jgi:mono/diheme cytochrome c family protein
MRMLPTALAALLALPPAAHPAPIGDVLVGELGCGGCHAGVAPADALKARLPDLGSAGLRYRPGYLFAYLLEPTRLRRHLGAARMPDFHLHEAEAVALVRFLGGERREPTGPWPDLPPGPARTDSARGAAPELGALLDRHSCLACHTFAGRGGVFGPPLDGAGHRLDPDWMRRFLVAPDRFGVPDGVMPALLVRPAGPSGWEETAPGASADLELIVDALASAAAPERRKLEATWEAARDRHPRATAAAGREVFVALNCAGCHPHPELSGSLERAPSLAGEGQRVRREWLLGYLAAPEPLRPLGTPPGSGSRMPDFRLEGGEVRALADTLLASDARARGAGAGETPRAELSAFALAKARDLLRDDLPCLGCHRLGADGGRIAPDLAGASLRLRSDFIAAMVRAPRAVVPEAAMPLVPMPAETRDLVVRYLVQGTEPRGEAVAYPDLVEQPPLPLPDAPPGRALYARVCAACHGNAGAGDGPNAAYLPVRPTAHADAALLSGRPDDVLFDGIFAGGAILGKSHRMPAWGETLSRAEIEELVAELRRLCDCAGPAWADGPAGARESSS